MSKVSPTPRVAGAQLPWPWLALLFALFAVAWFVTLGTRSLVHTDEGRYAALALEMSRSGDLVTPRLNGLLYFEKPPLQYWLGALSFRLFGINEFAARLWPGLAGLLTIVMLAYTAARLWGRIAGVQAFAIAAATTWIVAVSHVLTLDAGLTFFLAVALCAVLLAESGRLVPTVARRWVWVAWISMAGAVLSKGPVGIVVPTCTALIACSWGRDFGLLRRMRPATGLLIFLVIATPWFLLVSLRNRGFAEFFFVHEHLDRYLTTVHHHVGGWWYYVPLLLVGFLPWTSGLPWVLRRHQGEASVDTMATRLLAAWVMFVLVFFSLSGSKLPAYILPAFPALALLLTQQLRTVTSAALRWHLLVPTLLWTAVAWLASTTVVRFVSAGDPPEVSVALRSAARTGSLLFLIGAAVALWCLRRRHLTAAIVSVALGHFAALTALIQGYDAYGQLKSADRLSRVVLPLIGPDAPVFAVRSYDQTLPFYLHRDVTLVDYVDEFAFGEAREPDKWLATLDDFIARWQTLPRAAAYMRKETWSELHQRGVPMRIAFEDSRRLVVTKP